MRIQAVRVAKREHDATKLHDIETRATDLTTLYQSVRNARSDLRQKCRDLVRKQVTGVDEADIKLVAGAVKEAEEELLMQEKLLNLAEAEAREFYPNYFHWL